MTLIPQAFQHLGLRNEIVLVSKRAPAHLQLGEKLDNSVGKVGRWGPKAEKTAAPSGSRRPGSPGSPGPGEPERAGTERRTRAADPEVASARLKDGGSSNTRPLTLSSCNQWRRDARVTHWGDLCMTF